MINIQSVTGRIVIGKLIGLCSGIATLLALPLFNIEPLSMFGLGTVLMFMLMGYTETKFAGEGEGLPLK